jgi:phenylalanyl-tRNA synthetase beta chain
MQKKPLCIAGVYGGQNSGVTENTTSIYFESAYFNPVSIRKTAKVYGFAKVRFYLNGVSVDSSHK